MPYFLRTVLDPAHRKALFDRLDALDPSSEPRWGRMRAPAMLAHLSDQMRMPFNEHPSEHRLEPRIGARWSRGSSGRTARVSSASSRVRSLRSVPRRCPRCEGRRARDAGAAA